MMMPIIRWFYLSLVQFIIASNDEKTNQSLYNPAPNSQLDNDKM
jgi:hypothetical protein